MSFHLGLFGLPELRDVNGRGVRFRTQKQLALLVYLAIEARERPASRDVLVDLLWPDAPEAKARHSLSQALSAIRAVLGASSVESIRNTIGLNSGLTTDLERERLSDVRGDLASPLRDLDRCAGTDFALWLDTVRARCLKHVRDLLTQEVERARVAGDAMAVYERAGALYAVDPSSDVAAHALAERELLNGDTPRAVRFLREHLARSERDLGFAPHPDIKRLLRRIETGARPVGIPALEATIAVRTTNEVFVGREGELAQLEQAWAEARAGTFVGCLVTGDTGIGKSSLVRRFATSIGARGAPVLLASCQEIGSAIPFAVVTDLIHELMREPGLNATDPAWLAEASRIYPALRSRFPGVPEPPTVPGESIRLRVAEALFHMIEAVADAGPALLVLDDVQHIDPASLETIHALTRRLDRSPLLLVGTRRTAAGGVAAGSGEGLGFTTWTRRLDVTRLPTTHMLRLVSAMSREGPEPDERVRTEIVELADGNPYFAEMLLKDWKKHSQASLAATRATGGLPPESWQPPDTLRLAFARQFAKLAGDARELLNTLGVAGRAMAPVEAGEFLGWDAAKTDRAILVLLEEGVVRFDHGRVGFKNELHRAYVYYAIPVDLRRYTHGKIAAALAAPRDGHAYRTLLHASFHFLRADMVTEAVGVAVQGAAAAIEHGAPGEAEQTLVAVLELAPSAQRHKVNLLLAQSLAAQGKAAAALVALDGWQPSSPPRPELAAAARTRAELLLQSGRAPDDVDLVRAVQRAVATARLARDDRLIIGALQIAAEIAAPQGEVPILNRIVRQAKRIETVATKTDVLALAKMTGGFCLMSLGEFEAAERAFSSSAHLLEGLQLQTELRRVLNGIGICGTSLGHLDEAVAAFRKSLPLVEHTGDAHLHSVVWANLGALYQRFGYWTEACACMVEASRHAARALNTPYLFSLYQNASGLAIWLGALDQAEDLIRMGEAIAPPTRSWFQRAEYLMARADLCIAKGEPELAWSLVEEVAVRERSQTATPIHAVGFEHLFRYWTFMTRGYSAYCELVEERGTYVRMRSRDEQLQLSVFHQWAQHRQTGKYDSTVLDGMIEAGFRGGVARLVALRTCPPPIPHLQRGDSSAALVARLYPDPARGLPPVRIPLQ